MSWLRTAEKLEKTTETLCALIFDKRIFSKSLTVNYSTKNIKRYWSLNPFSANVPLI